MFIIAVSHRTTNKSDERNSQCETTVCNERKNKTNFRTDTFSNWNNGLVQKKDVLLSTATGKLDHLMAWACNSRAKNYSEGMNY